MLSLVSGPSISGGLGPRGGGAGGTGSGRDSRFQIVTVSLLFILLSSQPSPLLAARSALFSPSLSRLQFVIESRV